VMRRFFVGPCPSASADFLGQGSTRNTDDPLKQADWARFRGLIIGMREDELEAFIRDTAAVHWSAVHPPMGEEELAVILRDHAAFLRNARPPTLPERPDPPPVRGPLGMSGDELSAFIRDNKIEFYRRPDDGERELEEMLAAVKRAKPGRLPETSDARAIAQMCLNETGGSARAAKKAFIDHMCAAKNIAPDSAKNLWYEVTESSRGGRRVR
jgi:hypothetical protein